MKQLKRLAVFCLFAATLLAGCTKFGTAVSEVSSYSYKNKQLKINAIITDNGGCDYYMEQGFCYRLDTFPSLNDVFSTQVKVNSHTESDTFSASFTLPVADTTYFVCAYVKNNAGLSYSRVERVSTNPADYPETPGTEK
ncbi:MAG: hypothetical protein PUB29_12460 [Bacteroidales bacterium]|nr:hypothetical protein [Bacteroidales bacterium]